MLKAQSRNTLLLVIILLLAGQWILQAGVIYPKWKRDYSPRGVLAAELSPDQVLLQLFGFREFLAGILWVRADGFFDDGNYDAILPIIKICTTLDPKQIDIYSTGMWHIGYNFTDEQQRSDRRYLPAALALGKEGAAQNPNTYELFFETGWIWYHKIQDDPDQAVKWFEEAIKRPDMLPARKNLLSHAFERDGRPDMALTEFYNRYKEDSDAVNQNTGYGNVQVRDTVEQNIDNTIMRMVERGYFAEQRNDGSYLTGGYDTTPPFDTGFSCKMTIVAPRVLQFEGTWKVQPVGCRVRVILRDADYPHAKIAELDWDRETTVNLEPPRNLTYMQDDFYIKNQRIQKTIDMSKDPTMYPCVAKDYILEYYYNPRYAPPHIQDKFGWSGEGMRDSHFDNTTMRPGIHCMYTSLHITRDQLLRRGDWAGDNQVPVLKTTNYVDISGDQNKDEIIKVPTLRGK